MGEPRSRKPPHRDLHRRPAQRRSPRSNGLFDTGILDSNQPSKEIVLTEPGEYRYYCQLHPWMRSKITVLNIDLAGTVTATITTQRTQTLTVTTTQTQATTITSTLTQPPTTVTQHVTQTVLTTTTQPTTVTVERTLTQTVERKGTETIGTAGMVPGEALFAAAGGGAAVTALALKRRR